MTGVPTARQIEKEVNALLDREEFPCKHGTRVLLGTAKHEGWGWTVAAGADIEPDHKFEFYEKLTDMEEKLEESEHMDVMIAPCSIEPTKKH